MNDISQIDLARLAAYVESEGGMYLTHSMVTHRGHRLLRTSPKMMVSNTDIRLLDWCQRITGIGSINKVGKRDHPRWKQGYAWHCYARNAIYLAKQMLPYFVIKREQAEVLIAYERLILSSNVSNKGVRPDNQEQRVHLVSQMRVLNRRGNADDKGKAS